LLLEFTRQSKRGPDICHLRSLASASQEDHELAAALLEVDAVAWAVIDSQLRNAFSHGLNIAGISEDEALDPHLDSGPGVDVSQTVQPRREYIRLEDTKHYAEV